MAQDPRPEVQPGSELGPGHLGPVEHRDRLPEGLAPHTAARGGEFPEGTGSGRQQRGGGGEQILKIVRSHGAMLPSPADNPAHPYGRPPAGRQYEDAPAPRPRRAGGRHRSRGSGANSRTGSDPPLHHVAFTPAASGRGGKGHA
ncbi:hypothetical protein Slala02_55420 [Streptomyces lavendulae subsp. lavendulae]|nr:hypothetical protein Slala01_56580 [Streptomyces lavendulae subsp. lavendulae]GLX29722.1 hypothetical protein Slala02_55420 [Streptomyces lavendulae subsp. lavendulae]